MALLCVNRIGLPDDILSTIKDFAFVSFERKRIMQAHTIIHEIVLKHAFIFSQDFYVYNNRNWFFWSPTFQIKQRGFNMAFCKNCGNYLSRIYPTLFRAKHIDCLC